MTNLAFLQVFRDLYNSKLFCCMLSRFFSLSKDWLHHANQSLSRLKDVKKTSYSLGGGPREREVNCQCNYRSKSKSSFISLEAKPPQLALDSQETARYTCSGLMM